MADLKYTKVTNLKYADETGAAVSALVTFEGIGEIEFLCTFYDKEPHAVRMFAEIRMGRYGPIAPFEPDAKKEKDLVKYLKTCILSCTQWMVDRHRDQIELGVNTSLSKHDYVDLLKYRQAVRDCNSKKEFPNKLPWME